MSTRLFLVIILGIAFIQSTLLPTVLLEGVIVITYVFTKGLKNALPFIFIGGLILDLVQQQELGTSSLIFILISSLSWGLRNNITQQNGLFLTASALLINIVRYQVILSMISLVTMLFTGIVCLLFFNFFKMNLFYKSNLDIK